MHLTSFCTVWNSYQSYTNARSRLATKVSVYVKVLYARFWINTGGKDGIGSVVIWAYKWSVLQHTFKRQEALKREADTLALVAAA